MKDKKRYLATGFKLWLAGILAMVVVAIFRMIFKSLGLPIGDIIGWIFGFVITAYAAETSFGMKIPALGMFGKLNKNVLAEYFGKGIKIEIINIVASIPMALFFILVAGGTLGAIVTGDLAVILGLGVPFLLIGLLVGIPLGWYIVGYLAEEKLEVRTK